MSTATKNTYCIDVLRCIAAGKMISNTRRFWECPYCGYEEPLKFKRCPKCKSMSCKEILLKERMIKCG